MNASTPGGPGGTISQVLTTTPSSMYEVLFDLAGNPDGLPTIKHLQVSVDNAASTTQLYTFDITGKSDTAMGWQTDNVFDFTASSGSTTLTFTSQDVGGFGPVLDNVRAYAATIDQITTSQQPANATVGSSIADTATVTGNNPTGTVTFNLYNNSTATGPALFTDTETLSGGMATSKGYTATATGTDYWVATYNGDSNNAAVSSGTAAEPVNIDQITTSQQPANATVGSSIADTATVTGNNPTGIVTFNLYNNSAGTGPALFTDTETLSGGMATSKGYTATATGTDYWVATYSGDSNNAAVTSGTASEPVTVSPAALVSIALTPVNPSVPEGQIEQFTATGTYSDNSTRNLTTQVTWASATTSVATISSTGLAQSLATGTTNITAALGSVTSLADTLTVTVPSFSVYTVTENGDSPSDSHTATSGDLRYCVGLADANTSNPDGSLIQFDPTVFSTPQTITLGSGLVLSNTTAQTTITGPSAALTVSGGGPSTGFSVFTVDSGVTVDISGLTISGGSGDYGFGGGICNAGNLTVSGSTLSGNSASTYGGGIYNAGNLTVSGSTLSGNSATYGGGIANSTGDRSYLGIATVTNSTLFNNSAILNGGGIFNFGTLTVSSSTLSANSAPDGGGIWNAGNLTVSSNTLSGNSATSGGGIDNNGGTVTVTSSIVTGNHASSSDPDLAGAVDSSSSANNLIGDGTGSGLTATRATPDANGNYVGSSAARSTRCWRRWATTTAARPRSCPCCPAAWPSTTAPTPPA